MLFKSATGRSPYKSALIIGVTGQDGSYLAEYLLDAGYSVMGVKRRSSIDTTARIKEAMNNPYFYVVEGDITDYSSMVGVLSQASGTFHGVPYEVYNLAAQSHVGTSFQQPLATWDSTAKGVLNILEAMRQGGYIPLTRFYQASTSEMFGDNFKEANGRALCEELAQPKVDLIQDETVAFHPRSPYAVAKVAAHQAVGLYRDAYGLHGSCGILFNHESPRRGENFVTRKISMYVAKLALCLSKGLPCEKLGLGNMDARRDWGHAQDYVRAMYLMLQCSDPGDYVIATGEDRSVAEFCESAFSYAGLDYREWVTIDKSCLRPAEVPHLHGCANLAREKLGWTPTITFDNLVKDMVDADCLRAKREWDYAAAIHSAS